MALLLPGPKEFMLRKGGRNYVIFEKKRGVFGSSPSEIYETDLLLCDISIKMKTQESTREKEKKKK